MQLPVGVVKPDPVEGRFAGEYVKHIPQLDVDELILELRDSLGATIVVVTHELASIFAIGNNSVFLDAESGTMIASGDPGRLLEESDNPRVIEFLTRGQARNREEVSV